MAQFGLIPLQLARMICSICGADWNSKITYCEVSPSEGDWGNPQVCDYTIEEKRYSNTGERYVGVFWEGSLMMKYVFVPSERSISYQGRNGYVFGAYLQMKDIFPWH